MAIQRVYSNRSNDNPEATRILRKLEADGYGVLNVLIESTLRVEFDGPPPPMAVPRLNMLFVKPVVELASEKTLLGRKEGPIREISYKRAWTDPELSSARRALDTLGVSGVKWVRISKRYQFVGATESEADEIALRYLNFNPQVQTFVDAGAEWDTLVPQGEDRGVEEFDIRGYTPDEMLAFTGARRLHMPKFQIPALQEVFRRLGRAARDAEIEMIAAAWGDHCAHTTLKGLGLLRVIQDATAAIDHPLVVSAFVDNSGVMAFYGGWAICFKGETHISPTFGADPYGGIGTKHGGVIRDVIFTGQGAWPISGTTIMATADPKLEWSKLPKGAFHPATVLRESIRATSDYCNPMGIPMSFSRYFMDPRNIKGLALGHSTGVLPEARAKKGTPIVGDLVVLIGGETGVDGIHGATVSSGKMTAETSTVDAAHVQIGAPIEERKFMEAVPVLRDEDCIRACTDCGAAGLGSAGGEIGQDSGIWMNLAWVMLKSAGMARWQIFLSESQERGVLIVPPEKWELAKSILRKYEVPAVIIGVVTDSKRCQVVYDKSIEPETWDRTPIMTGEIVVDLPYEELTAACPLPAIEVRPRAARPAAFTPPVPQSPEAWIQLCRDQMGHYNNADQSWAAHRFDQTVQGRTVVPYMGGLSERMPDDIYVSTPVRGKRWGLGEALAVNQYYGDVDPAGQGRLAYAQAITKLVAAGFSPDEITTCVNVYTPSVLDSPENAWALVQLIGHGYAAASVALGVPVITGKDSSSGTYTHGDVRIDAPLTVAVQAKGRCLDAGNVIRKPFLMPGDTIVLYRPGLTSVSLGGSTLLDLYGQRGDSLPELNLGELRAGLRRYHEFTKTGSIRSRCVVADGGLIRSLFECGIGSMLGASVELPGDPMVDLFTELNVGILFTTRGSEWKALGSDAVVLGEVTFPPAIQVSGKGISFSIGLYDLGVSWSQTFNEAVA